MASDDASDTSDDSSMFDCTLPENPITMGLQYLWEQQLLVDFTIQVESRSFPAHQVVLAAASKYFRIMLTGATHMAERQTGVALIEALSADVMEILLEFLYKARLDITRENAVDVLAGAVYLEIDSAVDLCIRFIVANLDQENWSDALSLFRLYNLNVGVARVKEFLRKNIQDIVKHLNNSQLSYEDFCFFVDEWQSSEFALFHFIRSWADNHPNEKQCHIEKLIATVRFSLMTPGELEKVRNTRVSSESAAANQLVSEALEYHRLSEWQRVTHTSKQTTQRASQSFVLLSGNPITNSGYFYEPIKEKNFIEHARLKLPNNLSPCNQISINNFLALFTGSYDLTHLHLFNTRTLKWTELASLPREFFRTVITSDDHHIYALGGLCFRDHTTFTDIQCYDFSTNTWDELGTLPQPVFEFGACVLANGLYVSGGRTGIANGNSDSTDQMYLLDLNTHEWEERAPLMYPRSGHSMHAMIIHNEAVISICQPDFSLECYSPTRDEWTKYTFSFSSTRPIKHSMNMLIRDNTCYLFNLDARTSFRRHQYMCVSLTFPQEGSEAKVEYFPGYEGRLGFSYAWTVLAITPDSKLY